MPDIDVLAVLIAVVAAFVVSSTWYALVPAPGTGAGQEGAGEATPPPWKIGVELLRSALVAVVVAGLASEGEIDDLAGGLVLGTALWVGFPLVLLSGSVLWENVAPKLAALHAGDWLAKLLVIAVIVTAVQ